MFFTTNLHCPGIWRTRRPGSIGVGQVIERAPSYWTAEIRHRVDGLMMAFVGYFDGHQSALEAVQRELLAPEYDLPMGLRASLAPRLSPGFLPDAA